MMLPYKKETTIIAPDKINIPMSDALIKIIGMHIIRGKQNPVKTMAIIPRTKAAAT